MTLVLIREPGMDIRTLFNLGLDREIPELIEPPEKGFGINLGGGDKEIERCVNIDYPDWKAGEKLPFADNSVSQIHAYHFFEHLYTKEIIAVLREVERVLMVGGVVYILVPHHRGTMAFNDIDHKSFFNEEVWPKLLKGSNYYSHYGEWKLKVQCIFIMGIVERNLGLFTQLVKEGE